MTITDIKVTQRSLKRKKQIYSLIKAINENEQIEPIVLEQLDNGTVQINNGHHRLAAYYIAGRQSLNDSEYYLYYSNERRPTFGTVTDLVQRNHL